MNGKQIKALEWMNELEQYAKKQKLSIRILDNIDDCKKQITAENPNWNEVNAGVEDLLKSIERKTVPDIVQTDKNKNEVSIHAMKTRVTQMAEQCHTENEASVSMMTERKNVVIKKLYGDMQEISHTKAHLSELKNEDLYLEFFQKTKREYEKNVFQMIRETLGDISNNYNYMLEHMRSMFQNIGGYKNGLGNEKFYYEYTSRKDGIDKKIQNEVELSFTGGNDIISFGQKTNDVIKGIVKKLNRKRKMLIWLPLLFLLLCFSFKAITSQKQSREVIESVEAQAEKSDENSEVRSALTDIGKSLAEKAVEAIPPGAVGSFLTSLITFLGALIISLGALILFIVLLIIVLYAAYLKMLKLWCNHQIRKRCGEYLKTELIQFEQNNTLMLKLDEAMKTATEEYESQYLAVLNSIFSGTNYDFENSQNEEPDPFTALRNEWDALKYEQGGK